MTVEVTGGQSGAAAGAQGGASAGASTAGASTQSTAAPQTGAATSGGTPPAEGQPSTPPAYVLNDKYKVMGVEKKFAPWVASAIKDAETEKLARELYEKADGLEHVKADRQRATARLNEIEPKFNAQTERIGYLDELLNSGNIAVFQREVGISDDQILRRAQQIIAIRENPQLAAQENSSYESTQAMQNLRRENQTLQRQQAAMLQNELTQTLSSPDVANFAQQFDAKFGVGALQRRVIELGAYYQTQMKVSKSPLEIVQELMFPLGQPQATQQPTTQTQPPPAPPVATAPDKKPVIPNTGGKGTTPVKKAAVSSIDEIHARRKELMAANA